MFGHQDEPQQPTNTTAYAPAPTTPDPVAPTDALDTTAAPSDSLDTSGQSMVAPLLDAQTNPSSTTDTPDPLAAPAPTAPDLVSPTTAAPATDTNKLLDIKQQALQQLSPLVGHLDQSPEEKFRTTMMMIQAADNQELIGSAYEAAQAITDEKARAQALLDIVNEINYFTTQQAK